ncbi:MAG TPA: DUF2442 domain-containing protein [Pirellulales bacterium]
MYKPVEVRPLPGYRLYLRYADGISGEVDVSDLVGQGVFDVWNDVRQFEKVSIGPGGEIRWSDQIDLCPDALYLEITGKSPEEAFPKIGQPADA